MGAKSSVLSKLFGKRNPDLSTIDSRQKAEALFVEGRLEKLYLFPLDFGGADIPPNVVFVPIGIGKLKAQIDEEVGKLLQQGFVAEYEALPEYKEKSFIPSRRSIKAYPPEKSKEFSYRVDVW